jgi:spore coat polysaccharide biosynthesis protein SpsF
VQARTGSTRLPGKVLEPLSGLPMLLWTVAAVEAVPGMRRVVVPTTTEPADDAIVALLAERVPATAGHRGPVNDVLTRLWEAARTHLPAFVLRQTADNPFCDPQVMGAQLRHCREAGLDYVGIEGWPLGIAGEVARAQALESAARESTDRAEREHVMSFLYRRPERFRLGSLLPAEVPPAGRFTVDTSEDLAFARALADRLVHPPVSVGALRRILAEEPQLVELNRSVRQKDWSEVELG